MRNLLSIKEFTKINEADQPTTQPTAQSAPSTPPAQPAAQQSAAQVSTPPQPMPQSQSSGTTTPQAQAEPAPQSQPSSQEPSSDGSGNLSNYSKPEITNHPETVKKIVDLIGDLDKKQLIDLRNFIAKLKGLDDPKNEIGRL